MKKEYLKIKLSELKENKKNPKMHALDMIEKSIKDLGFVDNVVIDEKNVILAGHGRVEALKKIGEKEVEVIRISGWTEEQKEVYMILSNRSVEVGGWDFDKLENFDAFMLKEVGFGEEIYRLQKVEEDDFDANKEYEKIKEPKAKQGEIYSLGKHRIMCGDSASINDVDKLMNGKKGRLVFTDPPYNVNYRSPGGLDYNSEKYGGTGGKIFNDNKSDQECLEFYSNVLKNLFKSTKDDATIYWWYANINFWINQFAFQSSGWHFSQTIIWLKNSMVFSRGQDYHRHYEPCMLGWKKGKKHYKNKKINNLKDTFSLDFDDFIEMLDVWYEKRDNTATYVHPTQKPVRLPERALKKNSEVGDVVIDLFGGSGSTLMACEQMNRIFYGMELDPKYIDVIIARWEKYTKNKAKKVG